MDSQILKDAEMYLLGSIFNDPNAIYKAYSALSPQDFSDSIHGLVFASMQELANENIPIDILSVLEKCSRHSKSVEKNYLFELNECVPSSANFEHYITIIKDCSGRRALQKLCGKIAGMVKEDEKTEDIVSKIYDELATLGKKKKEPATAAESIAILNEMIANRKHLGIPTGIVGLDYKITGMRPGEMIVLAAPPSIGKTALALSIANNAIMSGKSVVFFTLEMTTGEIATRLVSMNSRVNSLHILNANLQLGEREKVQAAVELYVKTNIRIDDSSEIKVADMRMTCNAIKCKTGALDLVVVDYLQLIESSKKENQTIAMGDISRSLKIMAKELNVPVLCLSQLNRGYKDGKISLYNLRDSGNIEQDANQVWFITFPIANAKENEKYKHDPQHAILEIAKNRNGEKGTIDLLYEAEYTLFTDYPASRMVREPKAGKDGFLPVEDM